MKCEKKILQVIGDAIDNNSVTDNGSSTPMSAADVTKKLNILEAMPMLSRAWKKVTATSIQNCRRHAGFLPSQMEIDDGNEEVSPPPGMTANEFNQWVDIDAGIAIADEDNETEEDALLHIVEGLLPEQVQSDDDDLDDRIMVEPTPSAKEIGLEHRPFNMELFQDFAAEVDKMLREESRQSKIEDFFSARK